MYHAACKVEFQPFKLAVLTADVFQLSQKMYTFKVEKRQLWVQPFEWETSAVSTTDIILINKNIEKTSAVKIYFFK